MFVMDLLYRAFCGLGPMILTAIMNITASCNIVELPFPRLIARNN